MSILCMPVLFVLPSVCAAESPHDWVKDPHLLALYLQGHRTSYVREPRIRLPYRIIIAPRTEDFRTRIYDPGFTRIYDPLPYIIPVVIGK